MLKHFFRRSDLFRNISTLVIGTFLAQLVPILLQSYLRRVYPAEDFGAYGLFVSLTGMLMILASFRYEMATVMPEKKSDAHNLVFLGMSCSLLFSLLLFLVVVLFQAPLLRILNLKQDYGFMLYLSPLSIFLFSSYQIINYYLVREKAFKAISVNKLSRRIAEGGVQTSMGYINPLSSGLIWGDVFGHLVNNISGWIQMLRKGFSLSDFSWTRQWALLKQYKEFPLYNLLPAFLNAICLHLPLVLVNKFYSQEIAGYFDLTRLVLTLPASMLALSISQVLLQNLSEKKRLRQSIRQDMSRVIGALALLSALMVVIILLWAPWLFSLYAGPAYDISGTYARILVPAAALKLLVSPVSIIFIAMNKIKTISIWQATYFLLIASLFFFRHLEVLSFLKIYLLIDLLAYGIYLVLILKSIKAYEAAIKK